MRSLLEFIFVHVLVLFSAYLCACFIDTKIRMKCNERTQINPNKQKQIRINLQETELLYTIVRHIVRQRIRRRYGVVRHVI